ncbi:MAG TPA: DUF3618 domain-containing protein [Actinoplanes sp.]
MSKNNGSGDGKPDVDALRDDIKQTRAELGETVQALAAKADVKARAKDQVEQTKQRVKAQAVQATDKVREAALQATDKVKGTAVQATEKVKGTASQATDKVRGGTATTDSTTVGSTGGAIRVSGPTGDSGASVALKKAQLSAQNAGVRIRSNPRPAAGVLAAGAAILIVLLIIRGRRR